jgi:hypothetical protein
MLERYDTLSLALQTGMGRSNVAPTSFDNDGTNWESEVVGTSNNDLMSIMFLSLPRVRTTRIVGGGVEFAPCTSAPVDG